MVSLHVQMFKAEVDNYAATTDDPGSSHYVPDVPTFVIKLEMKTHANLMQKVKFSGVNPKKSFIMITRETKAEGVYF